MEEDQNRIDDSYQKNKGSYGALQKAEAAAGVAAKLASGGKAPVQAEGGGKSSLFTGKGRDSAAAGKSSGKMKKALPLIAILLILIVAAGAISFISQSFQLFSLMEQVKREDNKLSATVYTREENETLGRLNSTDPKDSLSLYMQNLFAEFGFDYVENDNGDGTVARALIYNGDQTSLIASSSVKDTLMNTLTSTGSIIDNYRTVASVADGNDEVAAAWYGALSVVAAAAWYDDDAALTYQRLGQSGNKFNSNSPTATDEEIAESMKAAHKTGVVAQTTGDTYRYEWETDKSSLSGCVGSHKTVDTAPNITYSCWVKKKMPVDNAITADSSLEEVTNALTNRVRLAAFSSVIASTSAQPGEIVFTASGDSANADTKSGNSLISAISAMVRDKTTDFAYSLANAVDKTKAGDGGTEMNYFGNLMNTPAISKDADGNEYSNIAATASTSFNSWFSDDVIVDPNNKIVQKYNVEDTLKAKGYSESSTIDNNSPINNFDQIENATTTNIPVENMDNTKVDIYCLDAGSDTTPCPGQGTISEYNVTPEAAEYVYAMTSIDLVSDPAGEEAAVAFNEGISLLDSAMLNQSSGTKGSASAAVNFYQMNQRYVAKLANYERHTKSPFDTSSQYTFLGSIVSSLLPFATATNSNAVFSTLSSAFMVAGSSIASLTPSASAVKTLDYLHSATNDNCYASQSAGMVCDVNGNPIAIMEQDKMNTPMSEVRAEMAPYVDCEDEEDENGHVKTTCTVKDGDNDYSDWLLCTQNDSVVNINGSVAKQGKVSFWQKVLSFFGLIDKKPTIANQVACGGNYDSAGKEGISRDKFVLFSQFTLDQRIQKLTDETTESASLAYLNDYYAANPIDNSYEGRIARLSGLTTDEVASVLAYMEYQTYLAHYNPATRYHFIEAVAEALAFEEPIVDPLANAAIVGKLQFFEELKDRSFAA